MKITYYGHACIGIEVKGIHIVVDPFISGNPKASHINMDNIKANYILLTHAHQDHSLDAEALAWKNGATIISNAEIADYYSRKGISTHPMNHGGSWKFDFGRLKYVNAIHSSSFADGTYGGNPAGFVLEADKNIYIAGDTALSFDMKLIPLRTKLDLVVLPIGDNFTMDIKDAIIASDFVECNHILGYHFDTFGFIEIDSNEAVKEFALKGKNLTLLDIGSSLEL
ncbi:MAG: metal-dependent hydrolase [Bacteroidota bacterium]|nr:metal-dependent hydrolase [Bacteroidota bacterium]